MRGAGAAVGSRTPPRVVRSPLKSVRRNNFFDNCSLTVTSQAPNPVEEASVADTTGLIRCDRSV